MKILVRNAGFSNKGAEAMLLTVAGQLWRRIPEVELLVCLPEGQAERAFANGITAVSVAPGKSNKLLSLA